MGAIEPARQAGSTDTKSDQHFDHDGFDLNGLIFDCYQDELKTLGKFQRTDPGTSCIFFKCSKTLVH